MTPPKRGRPPLDVSDPSVTVLVRLPSKQYDAMFDQARRQRLTVPEVIRRRLRPAKPRR
jgi:hypothetical protein